VASQFHPEFRSRPERPHPLFDGFVGTALAVRAGREPVLTARGGTAAIRTVDIAGYGERSAAEA
jgi:CTP synthase